MHRCEFSETKHRGTKRGFEQILRVLMCWVVALLPCFGNRRLPTGGLASTNLAASVHLEIKFWKELFLLKNLLLTFYAVHDFFRKKNFTCLLIYLTSKYFAPQASNTCKVLESSWVRSPWLCPQNASISVLVNIPQVRRCRPSPCSAALLQSFPHSHHSVLNSSYIPIKVDVDRLTVSSPTPPSLLLYSGVKELSSLVTLLFPTFTFSHCSRGPWASLIEKRAI